MLPMVLALAAAPILGDAAACEGAGPAVHAEITGLKDRSGLLFLELYPANQADFLADDNALAAAHKIFRRVRVPTPSAGPVSLCVRAPEPGRYALFFVHSRDGRNKFNLWQDGAGVPSNTRMGRAKPKLETALIDVSRGVTNVTIRTQYLHGLSGFSAD